MMSKYQEALKKIISQDHNKIYTKSATLLQELVDKETPIKMKWANQSYRACGNCNKKLHIRELSNYCDICGQKIDWGEEDE